MYGVRHFDSNDQDTSTKNGIKPIDDALPEPNGAGDLCESLVEDLSETLKQTIEGEIIPRLMLTHSNGDATLAPCQPISQTNWQLDQDAIDSFARVVLEASDADLLQRINDIHNKGVPLGAIYVNLLAPTARALGDMWVRDECHFVDVTVALFRLQHLLHVLSDSFDLERSPTVAGRQAVFSVPAGEQHTYGMLMLSEFFRREGWHVWSGPPEFSDEIPDLVSQNDIDVVGYSISRDSLLDELEQEISDIRRASRNPALCVMVGGRVMVDNPELVKAVGADDLAIDAQQAIKKAYKRIGSSDARA